MADVVSTGESSAFWEWGGDLLNNIVDGVVTVETEKAKNATPEKELGNTGNQSNTLTEAAQSKTAPTPAINPLFLYLGGGLGVLLLLMVLVFALRKRK